MDYQSPYELPHLITRKEYEHMDAYERFYEHYNMSYALASILSRLTKSSEAYTQKELTAYTRLPKQSVNNIIKELERNGSIELVPSITDKREKNIVPTEEGKAAFDRIMQPTTDVINMVVEMLGEEFLADLLHKLEIYCLSIEKAQEIVLLSNQWQDEVSELLNKNKK